MVEWLKRARMVRSDVVPELELLPELFRSAAGRLACPSCKAIGLTVSDSAEEFDDEAWGMARKCESCQRPIPRERLEIFPNTRLCVACQGQSDRGESADVAEYCPRCGNLMQLKQVRRGITRYVMTCPQCRS